MLEYEWDWRVVGWPDLAGYDLGNRIGEAVTSGESAVFPQSASRREINVGLRSFTLLAIAILAGGAVPASSGGKPVRLIAEAEDFSVESGWEVVPYGENYFASTFAITFLSRQACLGAPGHTESGTEAVASQVVDVPFDDSYQVLVRYEQPYGFPVEFTVEVSQRGQTVCRHVFGRLHSPKYWAFQKGEQAAMKRWSWGGGDNIVWEAGNNVNLRRGKATIRLIAGPQLDRGKPRPVAARRHVDVICLTNDRKGIAAQEKTRGNYLPFDGWLVQDGDLYVRVTNPADGLGPCVPIIEMYASGQHSPWWVHHRDLPTTKLVRAGRIESPTDYQYAGPHSQSVSPSLLAKRLAPEKFAEIPEDQYLQPGETSGWAPMGQVLDALHLSKWVPKAQYLERSDNLDLQLEFAVADGRGGLKPVKKIRVKGRAAYPVSPITLEMPGNVLNQPEIRTQREALLWLREQVRRFPKKGLPPKRFPIYGIMGFSSVLNDEGEIGRLATEIALALGDNTMTPTVSPHAEALGVSRRRSALAAGHWQPEVDALEKACDAAEARGVLDQIRLVSYGDEHYVPPARVDGEQFAAWLKRKNVRVNGPVKLAAEPHEPLFYYSQLCAFEKGVEAWAAATKYLADRSSGQILAGVNYGPASHNMVDEINFIRALKMRGMSLAWSEDYVWQMPEFSVQVTGYRTSGFRAGAKYHGTPILMYVMPHRPGNTPRDVRLSFYTAIAHGTTMVHFFCATPSAVGITENYIATEEVGMFRTVHDLCHEAGVFEDYVVDGRVRAGRVALLLSSVDDIRNPSSLQHGGYTNANRKSIYYALRHAQVAVDFLSEDDVIEGRADSYQLIYVTQEYLHSRAVQALQRWVQQGGTLVALCGGGFLDELNRPNPDAAVLYGVTKQSIHKDDRFDVLHFKQDLPPYTPLDTVTWHRGDQRMSDVPVILWKQSITPGGGRVIGTYRDGKPAVVETTHGKGKAVLFGFMPGLAYLKSGLPLRPWDRGSTDTAFCHFLPTEMDANLREALVDSFLPDGFLRDVECHPALVEATRIDSTNPPRLAVPLMNYTGKPVNPLTVKIHGLSRASQVRSVEHGTLRPRFDKSTMILTLPIDVTDMLLIDR